MIDLDPLVLTFKLAFTVTSILLLIGIPLSYWLTYSRFRLKFIVEALVSMPLVLPPAVLGFYLLLAFSPAHTVGKFIAQYFDLRLVFTFQGLILASVLYSLPFMLQPLQAGFRMLPPSLAEASYSLGKSRFTTLVKVLLPNLQAPLLTGIIMSFAHTVGEFGVVLMVGGNIPGQTRVVSIALYDEVEAMNYATANTYAFILFLFSFLTLTCVYVINHNRNKNHFSND